MDQIRDDGWRNGTLAPRKEQVPPIGYLSKDAQHPPQILTHLPRPGPASIRACQTTLRKTYTSMAKAPSKMRMGMKMLSIACGPSSIIFFMGSVPAPMPRPNMKTV